MLCSEPGCGRDRAPRGRYCRPHARRLNKYGDARGKPIPKAWLLHYAALAGRVLEANADHPGLIRATQELQQLLDEARQQATTGRRLDPATTRLARLAAHGVTPRHVLVMVCAVILFDQANPGFLSGKTPYQFAVARAVCGLVPIKDMPLRSRTLSAVGSMMVDRYSALAGAVAAAVAASEKASAQRKADMSAPFNPTIPLAAPSEPGSPSAAARKDT